MDPDGKYSVKSDPRTAALIITRESPEYVVSVRLTLTSPVLREGQGGMCKTTHLAFSYLYFIPLSSSRAGNSNSLLIIGSAIALPMIS